MAAIKKVGVVGAGIMGSGIAQVCAQAGYETMVWDITQDLVNKGLGGIDNFLTSSVKKGKLSEEEKGATLGRLTGTTKLEDFADRDLVIEAIVEKMENKKEVFGKLDGICQPGTILASNTSSLTVIEMAAATKRPQLVIGMHFFNPVPLMKLVEVVQTICSSEEAIQAARQFGETIGKTVVLAKDTPGFIVNRLLVPYLLDAIRVYEAGIATRDDIDHGMVLGCGYPMGPFTLLDLIGLDTTYNIAKVMFEEFGEARFAPPPLLRRMVLAGQFGRKTGKGFYDYK